jgi:hypothetical protein
MTEKEVLVLSPISDPRAVEDAFEVTAACGHKCWLSPGSQKHFLDENIESRCLTCFGGNDALAKHILGGTGHAADREELVRELRKALGL